MVCGDLLADVRLEGSSMRSYFRWDICEKKTSYVGVPFFSCFALNKKVIPLHGEISTCGWEGSFVELSHYRWAD